MNAKRTVRATYINVQPDMDIDRPFAVRGRDARDPERFVLINMSFAEMIAARDAMTELINNPPAWTRT